MLIEEKIILCDADIQRITNLEKLVHTHDQTVRDIYLESRFNFSQSMPAFWLATVKNELVGFLSVYADSPEEAEISVIVHPEFRRQGIATALIKQAKSVLKAYNISDVTYISERQFIEETEFLKDKYYIDWEGSEYIMEANGVKETSVSNSEISVREATYLDAKVVAAFQAKAFGSTLQEALTYAEGSIGDEDHALYVFENKAGRIVGSSSVNVTEGYYYLFGLAVDPDFQGRGVATVGIHEMMRQLEAKNQRPFRLAVENENEHARYLYEKNGFKVISEVLYLTN